MNPLSLFKTDKSKMSDEQKKFVKVLQNEAWRLAKLGILQKVTTKDVDKYERLCVKYNSKYPTEDFTKTQDRIRKFRMMAIDK